MRKKNTINKANRIKASTGERIFNVINVTFITLLSCVLLYPMIYVVMASFSNADLLIAEAGKPLWRPLGFTVKAYELVIKYPSIFTTYGNTLFVVFVGLIINMLLTIVGAYFITRKDIYGGKFISKFMIFTMFFSGGMIPFFLTVKNIGLLNSLWALILPTAISTYNLIIVRTAFFGVPDSLIDAAEIDGANDFIILWQILVPLIKPTLMVIVLYYAVAHWNSWFNAMIFINDRKKWPLQLLLRKILIQNSEINATAGSENAQIAESLKYAVIVVSTVPILAIYPIIQKYFVSGVMVGAVKG